MIVYTKNIFAIEQRHHWQSKKGSGRALALELPAMRCRALIAYGDRDRQRGCQQLGWRPSLVSWRPSVLGWRPLLVGSFSYFVGRRSWPFWACAPQVVFQSNRLEFGGRTDYEGCMLVFRAGLAHQHFLVQLLGDGITRNAWGF